MENGGGTIPLPVKIISGRHNRSIVPGASLFLNRHREQSINQYIATRIVWAMSNAHLSQKVLAFSIFC